MTGPGDGTRLLLTVLCAAWIAAFVFAFVAHGLTLESSDTARAAFWGWQGISGIIALAIFGVSRRWPHTAPIRRLGSVPLILALVLALGVVGFFVSKLS